MTSKPPMTEAEARENIAQMRAHTKPDAMARLIGFALQLGNLTPEARAVYQAEKA